MKVVRDDWQESRAAYMRRYEEERVERQLRMYFKPEFIERHRAEAERQFAVLRPEIRQRLAERDAAQQDERDAALEAELAADFERFLALPPEEQQRESTLTPEEEARLDEDFRQFMAEQGPSVAEAVELLDGALRREEDLIRAAARAEARRELEHERQALQQAAADKEPPDVGEVEMLVKRDENGKITSPVQFITTGAGNFEMTFTRGKDGRISRATFKPRG